MTNEPGPDPRPDVRSSPASPRPSRGRRPRRRAGPAARRSPATSVGAPVGGGLPPGPGPRRSPAGRHDRARRGPSVGGRGRARCRRRCDRRGRPRPGDARDRRAAPSWTRRVSRPFGPPDAHHPRRRRAASRRDGGRPGTSRTSETADEAALLDAIADLCAVAVDRNRLASMVAERSEWFERMAHTDPLTGLANQRTFARVLELELARAGRQGSEVSVAIFDVDDFADDQRAAGPPGRRRRPALGRVGPRRVGPARRHRRPLRRRRVRPRRARLGRGAGRPAGPRRDRRPGAGRRTPDHGLGRHRPLPDRRHDGRRPARAPPTAPSDRARSAGRRNDGDRGARSRLTPGSGRGADDALHEDR